MSAKLYALGLISAMVLSTGCRGTYVLKSIYDRDLGLVKKYNNSLEGRNQELEPYKDAYERLKGEVGIAADANRAYDEMAASLKRALAGFGFAEGDFTYDPKTGAFIFKTDLLFSSGSYAISSRGKTALTQFARANKGNVLKVVGHTDSKKIVKTSTKNRVPITKTNLELSVNRAVAVMGELIRNGIPVRNIIVEGRGSTQPRKGGNQTSRRVEIFIAGK